VFVSCLPHRCGHIDVFKVFHIIVCYRNNAFYILHILNHCLRSVFIIRMILSF
jgi:hypothetical protein